MLTKMTDAVLRSASRIALEEASVGDKGHPAGVAHGGPARWRQSGNGGFCEQTTNGRQEP